MNDFRVIIPILNEEKILKTKEFQKFLKTIPFEISFVDSCSTDKSSLIVESLGFDCFKYEGRKSIYGAVHFAASQIKETNIVILPADCEVDLSELKAIGLDNLTWGGFFKKYDESDFFIQFYLFLQNTLRTKIFKNLVWTNVIFCNRDKYLVSGKSEGFLEDVILSDALRKIDNPIILKGPCISSFRKYRGHFLKRLFINLKVMVCFRFKIKTIDELKEIYSN